MVTARNSLDKLTAGVSTRANLLTYFNSNLDIIDAAIAKCNFVAASDPTANDDSGDGYSAGSQWYNTTGHKVFVCENATSGSAIWRQIYPLTAGDLSGPAGATDGNIPLFDGATGKLLKNSAYSPASFAVAAKGVTNGDSHDHNGGDGAAIVAAATSFGATAKVLGRKTAGAGAGEECSITEILDLLGTAERGDVLYRGASAWAMLPHGVAGQVLTTGGNGADPSWSDASGSASFWTAETNFTATPPSTSTLTMTADLTGTILVGYPVKYTIGGVVYYGIVTAITSNLLTVAGAPLGGDVTALYWGDPTRVVQVDFFIPGAFADAANTGLLASDARTKFDWNLTKAYCVQIRHTVRVDDSGANQPRVTISIAGSVVGTSNTNAGEAVAETWTSTVVGINTTNYDINRDEAIEVVTDANGSNGDATDLTVSAIFVVP